MVNKHIISFFALTGEKPIEQWETLLAADYDCVGRNASQPAKKLTARLTINARSGFTDTMFIVYDMSKPEDRQIVIIASELAVAIDAYNEL